MRAPLRTVAQLLAGLALAGCNLILGYEDEYEPFPAGGEGGTSTVTAGGAPSVGGGAEGGAGGTGGGTGGAPACAHVICDPGVALDPACSDPCVATVCAQDAFCCTNSWDVVCINEAVQFCGADCCGDGLCLGSAEGCTTCPQDCGTCPCPHSTCAVGGPLDPALCDDPCAEETCAASPNCCAPTIWTLNCSTIADSICGDDPCITAVCAQDPACCASDWGAVCVDIARATPECATNCDCAHSFCDIGPGLDPNCDPCVAAICVIDPVCCTGNWDGYCTAEVATICGIDCGAQ